MQTNSFKEFEYKPKQSKYFSQGKYPQSIIILNYIDIYGFKNEYIYIKKIINIKIINRIEYIYIYNTHI